MHERREMSKWEVMNEVKCHSALGNNAVTDAKRENQLPTELFQRTFVNWMRTLSDQVQHTKHPQLARANVDLLDKCGHNKKAMDWRDELHRVIPAIPNKVDNMMVKYFLRETFKGLRGRDCRIQEQWIDSSHGQQLISETRNKLLGMLFLHNAYISESQWTSFVANMLQFIYLLYIYKHYNYKDYEFEFFLQLVGDGKDGKDQNQQNDGNIGRIDPTEMGIQQPALSPAVSTDLVQQQSAQTSAPQASQELNTPAAQLSATQASQELSPVTQTLALQASPESGTVASQLLAPQASQELSPVTQALAPQASQELSPVTQALALQASPESSTVVAQLLAPQASQELAASTECKAFESRNDRVVRLQDATKHSGDKAAKYGTSSVPLTNETPPVSYWSMHPMDDVPVPPQQNASVQVPTSPHPLSHQSDLGGELTQQEEAPNGAVQGDAPVANTPLQVQCTVNAGELVVSLSSSSTTDRIRTLCTSKTKEHHKRDSDDEDSDKRKNKAMDRLRKEREEKLRQNAAVKKISDTYNSAKASSGSGESHSDLRAPTQQMSSNVSSCPRGLVLLSNVQHIFQEGAYVPLPSQEAMAKTIGKGGNGVVAYIYHGRREFAVKETGLRQEELEILSSVNHRNVIELCAVVEGDWDSACPGARRCYQMMPRVTGDIKSLLEENERPTLCHYFFDFKEDSERAGLVLGNAKYILLGVLNGLKHLHSLNIVHRDIKLQNILIDRHCQCRDIFLCPHDGDSGYGVLISDFDSALQVDRGREKLERTKLHGRPIKYSIHGTAGYRPPETSFSMMCNEVLPEWVSLKTDIWSFGTMLVKFFVGSRGPHSQREMATLLLADCLQSPTAAQRPKGVKTDHLRQTLAVGPDEMKTLQKIALLEKYFPLATDLHRLVQFCLTVNIEERPTVEQVMEKAFFRPLKQDNNSN